MLCLHVHARRLLQHSCLHRFQLLFIFDVHLLATLPPILGSILICISQSLTRQRELKSSAVEGIAIVHAHVFDVKPNKQADGAAISAFSL